MNLSEAEIAKFWRNVNKSDGCWLWVGGLDSDGYGRIGACGSSKKASRVSWVIHNGPIPGKLLALHTCDNPPCVRPDHLFLGTDADNAQDKKRKGRASRLLGVHNNSPSQKLDSDKVRDIRRLYATGEYTSRMLGKQFSVNKSTINRMLNGTYWKEVI